MTKTRRHIVRALSFLIGLVILVLIAGLGLKELALEYDYNERKVADMAAFEQQSFDLLFMGNSLTNQGVIPHIIDSLSGTNSHNMALGGADHITMMLVLKDYLENNEAPKYLAYGVFINHPERNFAPRPSVLNAVQDSTLTWYADYIQQNNLTRHQNLELYAQLPLFRYRNSLKNLGKALHGEKPAELINGYARKERVKPAPEQLAPHEGEVDTTGLNALQKICDQHGIQLILFEPPNAVAYNRAVRNRPQLLATLKACSAYHDDMLFLNENVDYLDQKTDFSSLNHLNHNGAQKFSLRLGVALANLIAQ